MHKFQMPAWAVERVVSRQGRPLAHVDVPAVATALVVVDMQNHFVAPGAPAEVPEAREIVANVNRLAAALREAGGLVVWIRTLFTEEALATIPHFHHELLKPEVFASRSASLAEEASGSALWPDLDVREGDLVVGKTRYSAFTEGTSDLHALLKDRGIEALLVAGTLTNACCESTARDAMMLNYRTTMVSDANAALSDEEHAWGLINFHLCFGDVVDTDTLVARWA